MDSAAGSLCALHVRGNLEQTGQQGFVSVADWPVYDTNKVDVKAEETENLIKNVLEDTSNILRATKMMPKEIYYYYRRIMEMESIHDSTQKIKSGKHRHRRPNERADGDPELKTVAGKVAKFAQGITQEINRMPEDMKQRQLQMGTLDETRYCWRMLRLSLEENSM